MKLFISWSGQASKNIAVRLREWIPLMNQHIQPYMSEEDIEKGSHWQSHIRRELEGTSYGVVVLTPENTQSIWLHFEAGAIAKSVEEGRLAPILFGLKQSDVQQPLAMFQTTLFEKSDMLKLMRSINSSTEAEARDERELERVFEILWPELQRDVGPLEFTHKVASIQPKEASEIDRILQEILTLVRQQTRLLGNPEELFGQNVLSLLVRLLHDAEGALARLTASERDMTLALLARWDPLHLILPGIYERSLRHQKLEG
jgi:hypothetical protein